MPYKDKQVAKEYDQRRQRRRTTLLNRYKRMKKCKDCGINNPIVLEFHHLHDKIMNVSSHSLGRTRLHAEIKKCIILCANCHLINRRLTVGRRALNPGMYVRLVPIEPRPPAG